MDLFPMLDLPLSKKEQTLDFLEEDITYLLSLQPNNSFDLGSPLNDSGSIGSNADLGYVNVPTPFGSIASTVESFADFVMMDENDSNGGGGLTIPNLEQGGGSSWGCGDGFGIDPAVLEVDGGGVFDYDFDFDIEMNPLGIEPQAISMTSTSVNSQASSVVSSSCNLQQLGQFSTILRENPWTLTGYIPEETSTSEFLSFAPSPEPDHNFNTSNSPAQLLTYPSHGTKPKKGSIKTPPENKWIFVTEGPENNDSPTQRHGIRRGQLPPKARRKARRIREIGACWKCWVQKVPCSEGAPCETCTKHFSVLAPQMCNRTRLHEYVPVFFPEYLHSHFDKRKIEDLVTANSNGFTTTAINIAVSTGAVFEPLVIQTHLFGPKTWELIGHYHVVSREGDVAQLVERYSAPVGVVSLLGLELKTQCKKHIEEMISNPEYAGQVTAGHKTVIPVQILEIARNYDRATREVSLVHEALMLHGIHHFMGSMLTLTEESKSEVYQNVEQIGAPPGEYLTSRLLNRQIKYVMHILHREIYQNVLEGLEKSLKSSSKKDSWGTSFCTLLLLCLCIEELQTAADTFVMGDMRRDGAFSVHTRSESSEACTALEEYPFQQCTRLFHDVYRSRREVKVGGGLRDGLNPFRDLASRNKRIDLEESTDTMVKEVYELICNSHEEILELATRPSMVDDRPELDLSAIKMHNMGRVAAKFLHSFLDNPNTI